MTTKWSNAAAKAILAARTALFDGGTIEIRTGSPPTNVEDAATGTLLGTLTFSSTAFGAGTATSGTDSVATANAIANDTAADATGTAGYYRAKNSSGTAVQQGLCGTSGSDLNLVTTSLVAGQPISITSWTLTEPVTGG